MSTNVFDTLEQRGLVAQATDAEAIRKLLGSEKVTFYIGFDATADSLHVGHFLQLVGYTFAFDLEQTVQPDGTREEVTATNVRAYPTVTHYESGYGNIRSYMLRDYTEELAAAHGVRAKYPSFSMD
ncbi:hypothetical protein LJC60_09940, partial [Ruminococcaceae bacterium OttesenSCG-928-D13]|nr:hypothetical protein [Ruminococcaceae bacterium OttesenSCG-928-D13]